MRLLFDGARTVRAPGKAGPRGHPASWLQVNLDPQKSRAEYRDLSPAPRPKRACAVTNYAASEIITTSDQVWVTYLDFSCLPEIELSFPYREVKIRKGVDPKENYDLESEIGRYIDRVLEMSYKVV